MNPIDKPKSLTWAEMHTAWARGDLYYFCSPEHFRPMADRIKDESAYALRRGGIFRDGSQMHEEALVRAARHIDGKYERK